MNIRTSFNFLHKKTAWILSISLLFHTVFAAHTAFPISSHDKNRLQQWQHNSLFSSMLVPYDHPQVFRFKKRYLTDNGVRYLSGIMRRSAPYRDFILTLLAEENMPAELLFLPVIESGFLEKATSRAGAVGIWQFMRNSVAGFDLHINDWLDERRDPWKASKAAIKKLKWNYSQLNDWPLALAAYNCGMGAIRSAIRKAGKNDFWYLAENGYLKKETAAYVPKFLAVTEILSKSEELGIEWGNTADYPQTATIELSRAIDIALLAEEAAIEPDILKKLNPALHYSVTPPNVRYPLRIPAAQEETVQQILNESGKLLLKYYQYRIKSGDTLSALAKHYGVTTASIIHYNPGLSPRTLKIGKTIIIPALKSVDVYVGKKTGSADFSGLHTIQSGDTLWLLALKYNTTVEILAEKNNLQVNSTLKLGKQLKVPIL